MIRWRPLSPCQWRLLREVEAAAPHALSGAVLAGATVRALTGFVKMHGPNRRVPLCEITPEGLRLTDAGRVVLAGGALPKGEADVP